MEYFLQFTLFLGLEMDVVNSSVNFKSKLVAYQEAAAYPHIVFDNFLEENTASQVFKEFPKINSTEWINYTHYNEKKFGNTKLDSFPESIKKVVQQLNSKEFVNQLSELTGIPNLIADNDLEGGGLHQSPKGGFLNIHADFTVHPHHRNWQRRVNLLIYLNKNYDEQWAGELELWDRKMEKCCNKIAPLFNRCVMFNTESDTFHGHPEPFNCPDGESRKSIALYYFTEEKEPTKVQSTEYRAKPNEGTTKKILVWADTMLLRIYDKVKRVTGIDDKLASKILGWFSKK